MNEYEREEEYSLRFINVSLKSIELLRAGMPECILKSRRYYKDRSHYVGVIDLSEDLNYAQIEKFLDEYTNEMDYDIFVSISSSSDSEIVDIPVYIVDFIRNTNSRLTFSYTVTE